MKISIIMPSYNQARFVEAAIQSVLSQDFQDLELLFIDGGSTDGTMEIVEKYKDYFTHCISEPDNGQSDALHKGFCLATGTVLTWLNTDDLLLPGALRQVEKTFETSPQLSWLLGNVIWIDADDIVLKCWRGEGYTPGWMPLGLFAAGGPSAFFKKELYEQVGGMNLNLHYQMDTELWWRFAMAGERFHRMSGYIWALRLHEDAKMSGHMFTTSDNPDQLQMSETKAKERKHIADLTSSFRFGIPNTLTRPLSVFRRAMSPRYLRGKYDDRRYRGLRLEELIEER